MGFFTLATEWGSEQDDVFRRYTSDALVSDEPEGGMRDVRRTRRTVRRLG